MNLKVKYIYEEYKKLFNLEITLSTETNPSKVYHHKSVKCSE